MKSSNKISKNPSQTTFDSQKVFSSYTPEMKIYFSPNRMNGPSKQYNLENKFNSSFVQEKISGSFQRKIKTGKKFKEKKLENSDQFNQDSLMLNNFKSLRKFEIPKQIYDYTSYNSHQDMNINFLEKSDHIKKKTIKSFNEKNKYSFFQRNNKKKFSKTILKKESFFKKIKHVESSKCSSSCKNNINITNLKKKYRKSSVLKTVRMTRKSITNLILQYINLFSK
jgi:hypothetical protein